MKVVAREKEFILPHVPGTPEGKIMAVIRTIIIKK